MGSVEYSLTLDRSRFDIEPGITVRFSDEGALDTTNPTRKYKGLPNPNGTRGHADTRMMVLSADKNHEKVDAFVKLLQLSKKRGGFAPSAYVTSWTTIAGVSSTLTCAANVFGLAADGVDASRFTVGDKVRVARIDQLTTAASEESGFTITSISSNTIIITPDITEYDHTADPPLILFFNSYATASQTTAAKEWAHVGDSSGDIEDGGDACFDW